MSDSPYVVLEDGTIHRTADNAFIPEDEANADYQRYLAWKQAQAHGLDENAIL